MNKDIKPKGKCVCCGIESDVEYTTEGKMCWDCLEQKHEERGD